ncbi:hypothetical protein ABH926_009180 [Catenulispora sp. GP43]|uniref:transposase n=1 Tax=Catenulispora sp. GP43 TaxID=3156263 RepID=UPI0035155609
MRAALGQAGCGAVLKPPPTRPAVSDGFPIDGFPVDGAAGACTRPAGVIPVITPKRAVVFGIACRQCVLRARCTDSKSGRALHLYEHALLRAARAAWSTDPDLTAAYRVDRPQVERAIARVATRGGRRLKLRYHGTFKNNAWLHLRGAAINLRLLNLGLTEHAGHWALSS